MKRRDFLKASGLLLAPPALGGGAVLTPFPAISAAGNRPGANWARLSDLVWTLPAAVSDSCLPLMNGEWYGMPHIRAVGIGKGGCLGAKRVFDERYGVMGGEKYATVDIYCADEDPGFLRTLAVPEDRKLLLTDTDTVGDVQSAPDYYRPIVFLFASHPCPASMRQATPIASLFKRCRPEPLLIAAVVAESDNPYAAMAHNPVSLALADDVDTVISIGRATGCNDRAVYDVMTDGYFEAIRAAMDALIYPGLLAVDLCDTRQVLKTGKHAEFTTGTGHGRHRAEEAIQQALRCGPAFDAAYRNARGALLTVQSGLDMRTSELELVYERVRDHLSHQRHRDYCLVAGAVLNPTMPAGTLTTSLLVTNETLGRHARGADTPRTHR